MNKDNPFQQQKFKVIDCFPFFNELEVLRLRIQILENCVDHFAIVEARQTHTGLPKKCLLNLENAPDIVGHPKVHVKTIDLDDNISNWGREGLQRESARGLVDKLSTNVEDIILLSDVDEIPSPAAINSAIYELQKGEKKLCAFEQRLFYFRLNYELVYSRKLPWIGTTAIQSRHLTTMASMRVTGRNLRGRKFRQHFNKYLKRTQISDGGWHFSYAGQQESFQAKLQSFAHQERRVQESRHININELILRRGSLFSDKSSSEVWAIIPLEDLGLPESLIPELRHSSLVEASSRTPIADIIKDMVTKTQRPLLKLGNFELAIRRL